MKESVVRTKSDRISVLMYHEISAHGRQGSTPHHLTPAYDLPVSTFEAHMGALAEAGFRSATFAQLDGIDPRAKNVVITFDDGLEGNYEHALPVLQRFGFRAVFFVTAGWVGKTHYMSWEELRALCADGMEVQSHTVNHRPLQTLSPEEIRRELADSKERLERELGVPVTALSFPHGSFNDTVLRIASEVGYRTLCTSDASCNPLSVFADTPVLLGRIAVTSKFDAARLRRCAECDALEMWRQRMIKKSKNLAKRIIGVENYRSLYRKYFNISTSQDQS